jgi:hypothetical protein
MNTEVQEVEITNRLSLKDLGCNPKEVKKLPENTPKLRLAIIFGAVNRVGYQEDKNQGKSNTYFIGQFEGMNLQTGETLSSAKLFLPQGASDALEGRVLDVQSKRGKGSSVQFAFEIRAVKADNQSGYTYETSALLKPELADPIAAVRELVKETRKAHAKPHEVKAAAAPTAKPA